MVVDGDYSPIKKRFGIEYAYMDNGPFDRFCRFEQAIEKHCQDWFTYSMK